VELPTGTDRASLGFVRHGRRHPRRSSAGAAYGPHLTHAAARDAASEVARATGGAGVGKAEAPARGAAEAPAEWQS
jgi:hypothetical protein